MLLCFLGLSLLLALLLVSVVDGYVMLPSVSGASMMSSAWRHKQLGLDNRLYAVGVVRSTEDSNETLYKRFKKDLFASGLIFDLKHQGVHENSRDKRKRKIEKMRVTRKFAKMNELYQRSKTGRYTEYN